jgi:hypothetical protein
VSELLDVDVTVKRIEALLDEMPESGELVQLLMHLYGAGLARIVELLDEAAATSVLDSLADDKLVASLLLLHGLHPVDAETRLRRALQRVECRLESQRIVLSGINGGVARIRIEHNGGGSPPASLAAAIEQTVVDFAPDLSGVEIEGIAQPSPALVQIEPARSA